ncbi:DUF362 domain-containing protein [Candidatus Latescibacterota bacterium]
MLDYQRLRAVTGIFVVAATTVLADAGGRAVSHAVSLVASDDGELAAPAARDQTLSAEQIEDMVRRAVDLIGGMSAVVADTAHLVAIKPNITIAQPSGSGIITDARIIRAVAILVHEVAPEARILITEGPGGWVSEETQEKHGMKIPFLWDLLGGMTADGFEVGGYRVVAEELRGRGMDIACFDINFDEPVALKPDHGGLHDEEYIVASTIVEADAWINCPVMKTHGTKITCAMKNQYGILPGAIYGISKSSGTEHHGPLPHDPGVMDEIMVDLWMLTDMDLNVVDGIVGHEAGGLTDGEPIRTNMVLASRNPVAADLTAAYLMGFNPDDMEFAELAHRVGRGPRSFEQVEVRGRDAETLRQRFKKAGDAYKFVLFGGKWTHHANFGMGPRYWSLLGPLPREHTFSEEEILGIWPVPGAEGWSPVTWFGHDMIDLDDHFDDPDHCAVYAFTRFTMPTSDDVHYWVGSDEGLTVWIDGEQVYEHQGRRIHTLGMDRVPGHLEAGEHRLLVRAGQRRGKYEFSFNICEAIEDDDYAGNRYPGVKYYPTASGR